MISQNEIVQAAYKLGYFGFSQESLVEKGARTLELWGHVLRPLAASSPIPVELLAIRIGHETNGNRLAVSSADERGLMQWGPWHDWGSRYGVGKANTFKPEIAVAGGIKMWEAWDKLIVSYCERVLKVKPEGWDRWALLWCALSNGRGGLEAFLSKMDPDRSPVLMTAVHEMVSPSGSADMFKLAAAGRFGLKPYHPNWTKVVQTVTRRIGRSVAAAEAAAALGGDMSYGTSFILGSAIALLVLLAIQYGPALLGGVA